MDKFSNVIDDIIDYELNTGRKKLISKISDNINFKYNCLISFQVNKEQEKQQVF